MRFFVLPIFDGVIIDGHPIFLVVDTGYDGIHHSKYWMPIHYDQAGDTRIPLPRESLWTPQKIVDCKVGLCTSLRTVAEFL